MIFIKIRGYFMFNKFFQLSCWSFHIVKYNYFTLSTITISNVTGHSSKYPVSASQRNFSTQAEDRLLSLVTPIESQRLSILCSTNRRPLHNGSTNVPPSLLNTGTCNTNQLLRNLAQWDYPISASKGPYFQGKELRLLSVKGLEVNSFDSNSQSWKPL